MGKPDLSDDRALIPGVAKRLLGVCVPLSRTHADAEDIASETWLRFCKCADRFDPQRASLLTFLRAIARNAAIDFYRKVRENDSPGARETAETAAPIDLEFPALRQEYERILLYVMSDIGPPHQRITFGFHKMLEWNASEIAGRLSPRMLGELAKTLAEDYRRAARLPGEYSARAFAPLMADLARAVGRCLKDSKTRSTWMHLADKVAKDTRLEEYYTGGERTHRTQNIEQWSTSLRRRVILRLASSGPKYSKA